MTKKARQPSKSVTAAKTNAKSSSPGGRQRQRSKKQIGLSLLQRAKGASIAEMQDAMGWQPHSVRGFLAGTVKKMPGVTLTSEKTMDRPRRYRVEAAGVYASCQVKS